MQMASELLYLGRWHCQGDANQEREIHLLIIATHCTALRAALLKLEQERWVTRSPSGFRKRMCLTKKDLHVRLHTKARLLPAPGLLSSGAGCRNQESRQKKGPTVEPPLPKAAPLLLHSRGSRRWPWSLGELTKWPTLKHQQFIDLENACSALMCGFV